MLVNFLMESGVDANATTFAGEQYTLWLPCYKDIPAKLYELLHCVLYTYVPLGNTPLHVASGRKMKEIVAVLMAYGANPGIANYEGDLPSGLPPPSLVVRLLLIVTINVFQYFMCM